MKAHAQYSVGWRILNPPPLFTPLYADLSHLTTSACIPACFLATGGRWPPVCFLHIFVSLLVNITIQDGSADSSEKDLCYL